jgi:hypothetical protein
MKFSVLIIAILLTFNSIGQSTESDTSRAHSPKKATLLSLAMPGAGQIYNKKYWKLPIVYGGIGLSVYYLDRNLKDIRYFKKNLIAIQDDDPATVNETLFSENALEQIVDQRKNWRDLSYVAIGLVYALQVLDANVDAHLFYFDVDRDLSLYVLPYTDFTSGPTAGLHLGLNF